MNELEQIKAEYAKLGERIAELEKQAVKPKGYAWEECFKKEGYYVDGKDSSIIYDRGLIIEDVCHNIATTERLCKSHLAACQLSHIIEKLNEDFRGNEKFIVSCQIMADGRSYCYASNQNNWALPFIKSSEAFSKLIETNSQLLKQYFGIDE